MTRRGHGPDRPPPARRGRSPACAGLGLGPRSRACPARQGFRPVSEAMHPVGRVGTTKQTRQMRAKAGDGHAKRVVTRLRRAKRALGGRREKEGDDDDDDKQNASQILCHRIYQLC